MANLRDIRNRISSVNNTEQITKAMKMVAAAKLKKAQERMVKTRPYAAKIQEVAAKLVKNSDSSNPILKHSDKEESILFIVVGSDRGLCGGFNNNLFKEFEKTAASSFQEQFESKQAELITIGKKSTQYFKKRKYNVVETHPGFFDEINYQKTSALMEQATEGFVNGKYDSVYIVYNEFRSVIAQNRMVKKVLPIESISSTNDDSKKDIDYLYEPDSEGILERILPLHLNMQLWRAVLESNASEQGARMSAMDSATENAKELKKTLKLKYNQARQSAITTEISEIVSGAQALSDN